MKKIFSILLFAPVFASGQTSSSSQHFNEAMGVCENMGMYVQSAQRQFAMGMPQEAATELATGLMNKNLNLDNEVKSGAIALAKEIYSHVYLSPEGKTEPADVVLAKTCGSYRGYNLPREQVEKHLANTVQSAWNPLVRVPLCTKVAQSAANIATARDKGITRKKISGIAATSLRDDKFTSAHLAGMINEAYDNPNAEVAFLYIFNLGRCTARQNEREYPSLTVLSQEYAKCKAGVSQGETLKECHKRVFQVEAKLN
jgi:hypothetical protein